MSLQLAPENFKQLNELINLFNNVPEDDGIQKLFYLQKINYHINTTELNDELYYWIYAPAKEPNSWLEQLGAFNINFYASFFLKGFQFAKAVTSQAEQPSLIDLNPANEYDIMQKRDELLKNGSFKEIRDEYIHLNILLNRMSTKSGISEALAHQEKVLTAATPKIQAMMGEDIQDLNKPSYKTVPLGQQNNNHNYVLKMGGWDKDFVLRVELRTDFGYEQELHSYPVSQYFLEESAIWRMPFKVDGEIQYRPVVLSQFANGGDLGRLAEGLNKKYKHDKRPIAQQLIASDTVYYFTRMIDFCIKLKEAKTYHPDIKLTNFLVRNKRLGVADRKALLTDENPLVNKVISTPAYATEDYISCLNPTMTGYNFKALKTRINLPKFMAFQLGMALKEFLILTQEDDLPDNFREINKTAASCFTNPHNAINNLSVLAQELTHPDENKRMTIEQFRSLLLNYLQPSDIFNAKIEEVLPSSALGIAAEMEAAKRLIESTAPENEYLTQANEFFANLNAQEDNEPRLLRMAQKLAVNCFNKYSLAYFRECSDEIEAVFFNKDWELAPWYRKLIHAISFGYFRVEHKAVAKSDDTGTVADNEVDIAKITISKDLKGEEFQRHFMQLTYLPLKEFKKLGDTQWEHFERFIMTHEKQIIDNPEICDVIDADADTQLDMRDKSLRETIEFSSVIITDAEADLPAAALDIKADGFPIDTVVITETDQPFPPKALFAKDSLPTGAEKQAPPAEGLEDADQSLPTGTVVIVDNLVPDLPANAIMGQHIETPDADQKEPLPTGTVVDKGEKTSNPNCFFADNNKITQPTRRRLICYSIQSTLFMGDGSGRYKQKAARPHVSDLADVLNEVTTETTQPKNS